MFIVQSERSFMSQNPKVYRPVVPDRNNTAKRVKRTGIGRCTRNSLVQSARATLRRQPPTASVTDWLDTGGPLRAGIVEITHDFLKGDSSGGENLDGDNIFFGLGSREVFGQHVSGTRFHNSSVRV